MSIFKTLFATWLGLSCGFISGAQTLPELVKSYAGHPDFKGSSWGITVIDAGSGNEIISYGGDVQLIPASTLKTITTSMALKALGPEFKFNTILAYDGSIDSDGKLNGNLWIRGSGDPTLDSEVFRDEKDSSLASQWADSIKKFGITSISGKIIADASLFDENPVPSTWIWGDMGNYYGAGSCGLNYKDNKYTVYFKSGSTGSLTQITKVEPSIPRLVIENKVTAGGSSDNAFIYGQPYSYKRMVSGTIPANRSSYDIQGSMPDPALLCAQDLKAALQSKGITVGQSATTLILLRDSSFTKPGEDLIKTFLVHSSPKLSEIVGETNLHSNNLYAETLLKTMGSRRSGLGNDQNGIAAVENELTKAGLGVDDIWLFDGAGLSRHNSVTTSKMAGVLYTMTKDSILYRHLSESLPTAGRTGSLKNLCRGTFAENNLRAKSGYLNKVRAYCGYVNDRSGRLLCFSIIVNNYRVGASQMKSRIEKLMTAIAELKSE